MEASQERLLEEQAMKLYMAYPRHVARGVALRAIRKALLTEEFAFLMAAVTEYRGAREAHVALDADNKSYTPYPATWFNQERYHDDRDEWYPPGPEVPTELGRWSARRYGLAQQGRFFPNSQMRSSQRPTVSAGRR